MRTRGDFLELTAEALIAELSSSFDVHEVTKLRDYSELMTAMTTYSPRAIVILDKQKKNTAVEIFQQYAAAYPDAVKTIACIYVKDIFPDTREITAANSSAIFFQAPVIVGMEKLRKTTNQEVGSVGIIYRRFMRKVVQDASQSCAQQGISPKLKAVPDSDPTMENIISNALDVLNQQKIDALWVLDDDKILTPDILQNVWIPFVKKHKIPVIVADAGLMTEPYNLGTVCVVPDSKSLGSQIAKKVVEIQRNNWTVTSRMMEPVQEYRAYLSREQLPAVAKPATPSPKPQAATPVGAQAKPVPRQPVAEAPQQPAAQPTLPQPGVQPQQTTSPAVVAPSQPTEPKSLDSAPPAAVAARIPSAAEREQQRLDSIRRKLREEAFLANAQKEIARLAEKKTRPVEEKKLPAPVTAPAARAVKPVPSPAGSSPDQVQSIAKYIVVINRTVVRKDADSNGQEIGYALKGHQFPVFEEKEGKYRIAFFNVLGWIDAKDVQPFEEVPGAPLEDAFAFFTKNIVVLVILGVVGAGLVVLLLLFLLSKLFSRSAKMLSARTCVVVFGKGNQDTEAQAQWFKGVLSRIGFRVVSCQNISKVKQVMGQKLPDMLCIDWMAEEFVDEKVERLIRGRFDAAAMQIIFYNVVSPNKGSAKINATYLGSDFNSHDLYRIVAPAVTGQTSTSEKTAPSNLEGEITREGLADIFQFIEQGKKTGCLMVEDGKPFGMVFFDDGWIIHATTIKANGRNAVFQLLGIRKGSFKFVLEKVPQERTLQLNTFEILMEWAKETDEASREGTNAAVYPAPRKGPPPLR